MRVWVGRGAVVVVVAAVGAGPGVEGLFSGGVDDDGGGADDGAVVTGASPAAASCAGVVGASANVVVVAAQSVVVVACRVLVEWRLVVSDTAVLVVADVVAVFEPL